VAAAAVRSQNLYRRSMTPTLARQSQGNAGGGSSGGSGDGRATRDEGCERKGDERGAAAGIRTLCMRFGTSTADAGESGVRKGGSWAVGCLGGWPLAVAVERWW